LHFPLCIRIRLTLFQIAANGTAADAQMPYDPFSMSSVADAMPSAPYNPYLQDNSAMPSNGAGYYQHQPSFAAPAQPVSKQFATFAF